MRTCDGSRKKAAVPNWAALLSLQDRMKQIGCLSCAGARDGMQAIGDAKKFGWDFLFGPAVGFENMQVSGGHPVAAGRTAATPYAVLREGTEATNPAGWTFEKTKPHPF